MRKLLPELFLREVIPLGQDFSTLAGAGVGQTRPAVADALFLFCGSNHDVSLLGWQARAFYQHEIPMRPCDRKQAPQARGVCLPVSTVLSVPALLCCSQLGLVLPFSRFPWVCCRPLERQVSVTITHWHSSLHGREPCVSLTDQMKFTEQQSRNWS